MRTAGDDDVMNRVRVELSASGWSVVEFDSPDSSAVTESLAHFAPEHRATAVVRVDAKIGQIEIFIGRAWGDIEETLHSESGQVDAQVLALRTTEALRAHGLDLGTTGPYEARTQAPPAEVAAPNAHAPVKGARAELDLPHGVPAADGSLARSALGSKRGLWIEAAPTVIGSPGGLGFAFAGWAGLRIDLSPACSIAATGIVPITTHQINDRQGQANVSTGFVGISAQLAWLQRSFGSASLGLGAAALVTSMKGTRAQPGYTETSDVVVTLAPFSYLRTGVVLGHNWQFFGLVLAGSSIPEVRVAFAESVVRTWGQPFGLLATGLEWRSAAW